jgi:hypothetical protein
MASRASTVLSLNQPNVFSEIINAMFCLATRCVLLFELTLAAPGNIDALPSVSIHFTNASLVTGACFSIINCSMHWLEFMTSRQAISSLGQPSFNGSALFESAANGVATATEAHRANMPSLKLRIVLLLGFWLSRRITIKDGGNGK